MAIKTQRTQKTLLLCLVIVSRPWVNLSATKPNPTEIKDLPAAVLDATFNLRAVKQGEGHPGQSAQETVPPSVPWQVPLLLPGGPSLHPASHPAPMLTPGKL